MKKTILYVVLATLCLSLKVNGQVTTAIIKPLKIGDVIPEAVWNMPLAVINHPQNKKAITLGQFRKKKLIILDFWATWCSPCIASLDNLAPIYHQYSDEMMLLPIASHNAPSIDFAENVMKGKKWGIPSVIDSDQYLYTKIFPPASGKGIPHMIWIKDNKIIAMPKTGYATLENILKAIKGERLEIEMDTAGIHPLNLSAPLFVKNNGKTGLYYRNPPYSVIARFVSDYGVAETKFFRIGDTSVLSAVNRRLEDLLFDAFKQELFPDLDSKNGIIWKISDSLKNRLFNGPEYDPNHLLANEMLWTKWLIHNSYGYNLRFPENISEQEARYFMQQDLKKFFGLYLNLKMSIEPAMKHKFAVLKTLGSKEASINVLKHKGNKSGVEKLARDVKYSDRRFKQTFIPKLEASLQHSTISSIIDSTGISPDLGIDFTFPNPAPKDTKTLNEILKKYGLWVDVKEKYVPVLVVREEK